VEQLLRGEEATGVELSGGRYKNEFGKGAPFHRSVPGRGEGALRPAAAAAVTRRTRRATRRANPTGRPSTGRAGGSHPSPVFGGERKKLLRLSIFVFETYIK